MIIVIKYFNYINRFPGEPKGTCPSKELYSCQVPLNKVIGCTNHHPNYGTLMTMDIPTISIMREPYSRSISAFFYPGIHHNSNCKVSQKQCYLQYTSNLKWQNIGVKLLTGLYAYSNVNICQYIKDCRHSLELALLNLDRYIYFMGIAEMWELSILILHHKFPKFTPQLSDFLLSGNNNNSTNRYDNTSGILFDDYNKELLKKQEIRENLKASSNKYSSKSNNKKRLLSYFNASYSKNNNNHNNSILYDKNRYLLLSDTTASYRSNNDEDYKQFKSSAYEKYSKQLFQQNSFDVIIYRRAIYNMCKELHYFNLWDLNIIKSYWELRTPYYISLCS